MSAMDDIEFTCYDNRSCRYEDLIDTLRADNAALKQSVSEARELRALAEEMVDTLGYWLSFEEEPQECYKAEMALGAWLTAHPANDTKIHEANDGQPA